MSTFGFLVLCLQACLVQNVYSQCLRGAELVGPAYGYGYPGAYALDGYGAGYGYGYPGAYGLDGFAAGYGYGPALAAPLAYEGAYGGEGVGDVAVLGELPVAGTTLVAGQVPILGAVEFGGIVPAAGSVTISGSCGCGCRGSYLY